MRYFFPLLLAIVIAGACSTGRQRRAAQEARIQALMEDYKNCKTEEECFKAQKLFEMELRVRDAQLKQEKVKGEFWRNALGPKNYGPQFIQSTQIHNTETAREPQSSNCQPSSAADCDSVTKDIGYSEMTKEEKLRYLNDKIDEKQKERMKRVERQRQEYDLTTEISSEEVYIGDYDTGRKPKKTHADRISEEPKPKDELPSE